MSNLSIDRFELADPTHGPVPCVSVAPLDGGREPLPLVLFLYGGGGSEETLAQLAPFFEDASREHAIPAMRVASARVPPFGFYLDDPARVVRLQRRFTELHATLRRQADDRAAEAVLALAGAAAGSAPAHGHRREYAAS